MHVDTLPQKHKDEFKNRLQVKNMLTSNRIKHLPDNPSEKKSTMAILEDNKWVGYENKYSSEQFQSTDYKRNFQDLTGGKIQLPNASELLYLITSEYLDDESHHGTGQYRFNLANQPVTTRHPNKNQTPKDKKYMKAISRNIKGWNELFYKYYQMSGRPLTVKCIKLLFVMETENEFIVKVNASLLYLGKSIHFQITYYGQIDRSDDFLNGNTDVYVLQPVEIRPIPKSEFAVEPLPMNENESDGPFMTMNEQLQYVDRINKMHQDEDSL